MFTILSSINVDTFFYLDFKSLLLSNHSIFEKFGKIFPPMMNSSSIFLVQNPRFFNFSRMIILDAG